MTKLSMMIASMGIASGDAFILVSFGTCTLQKIPKTPKNVQYIRIKRANNSTRHSMFRSCLDLNFIRKSKFQWLNGIFSPFANIFHSRYSARRLLAHCLANALLICMWWAIAIHLLCIPVSFVDKNQNGAVAVPVLRMNANGFHSFSTHH